MSVTPSDSITALQFNNLQSRIEQLLGNGSGDFGYGQSVTSSQVTAITDPNIPNGDTITASQFNSLRTDLETAFIHQNGTPLPINTFNIGDIIGADESGTDLDLSSTPYTFINSDQSKGFNDLLSTMTDLETNRFIIAPSEREEQVQATDARNTDWYGTITSVVTVTFANLDARRHFFNSGGLIKLTGDVDLSTSTGDSLFRDQGWSDLIENPGDIQFGYNSTTVSGSSSGITFPDGTIGNYQLTSNYQTIFRKNANSGIYYGNSFWTIQAKENSSNVIEFLVSLIATGPEGDIIEDVTANIGFDYTARRSAGEVTVGYPSFSVINSFE
jgi:hypothetical protein